MNDGFIEKIKVFRQDIICCVLIAVAVLLMFGRAAGYGGDIWDDQFYLGMFREGSSFSQLIFQLKRPVLDLYSPLVTLSFYLDRLLCFSGDAIAAAHKWNIFYFILSTWGLYLLFREIKLPGREDSWWRFTPFWASAAVLLWALHPQRAESVVWISERKDVLLACCAWWSWALFIRAYRKKTFSTGAFILYILSFGIKPMLLLFPAVLGLWIYAETRSLNWRDYRLLIPWAAVAIGIFLLHILFVDIAPGRIGFSCSERVLQFVWNCGNYAVTALFPVGFGPFHPFYPEPGWGNFYILCLLLILYLSCFIVLPKNCSAILVSAGCAMICFGLLLAPVLGMGRVGNADWADRYNLLSSAMSALAVTALAAASWKNCSKMVRCTGLCSFSVLFIWGTIQCHLQVPVWKCSESVIKKVLENPFPNYRILFVCAARALEKGDEERFAALTKRFLPVERMNQFDAENIRIFHLATAAGWDFHKKQIKPALEKVGRLMADPSWKRICSITDGFPQQLLTQAAEVCLQSRQFLQAAFIFDRLALCYPGDMEAYFYKGLSLIFRKKYAEAVVFLEKAEKMAPEDTAIKYQLDFARRNAAVK